MTYFPEYEVGKHFKVKIPDHRRHLYSHNRESIHAIYHVTGTPDLFENAKRD